MTALRTALAAAVASLILVSSAKSDNVPGTTNQTISVDGVDRTFVVHIGQTAPANQPVPVVFMFHGTGGDGQRFYENSGWREKADAEGFIAVFPDALRHCFYDDENRDGDYGDPGELKLTTKWAAGQLGEGAALPPCPADVIAGLPLRARGGVDHPIADDLAFVDAIVDFLAANYVVDPHRIYASGFSNGAQMTTRLAVERSNVFAAIGAHAGNLSVPVAPARPVPFVMSYGSLDDRVLVRARVPELPISEDLAQMFSGLIADMLMQFGLAPNYDYSTPEIGGKRLATLLYDDSLTGVPSPFYFIVVEDNFHAYPNGQNHRVSMANLLWEFFVANPLP